MTSPTGQYIAAEDVVAVVAVAHAEPCKCDEQPNAPTTPESGYEPPDSCFRCVVLGLLTPVAVTAYEPPF